MFMIKLMAQNDKVNNPQPLILAVSGGVDSVVMLDQMAHKYQNLVVAHFEHGIRGVESKQDADFVRNLARSYGLKYEIMSAHLGEAASEEAARVARYAFLRQVAQEYNGLICTAHHADDVLESIAINLKRGTTWRGLAVMGASDVYRPLLYTTKAEILAYALDHQLKWREDATNQQTRYLRNQLRQKITSRLSAYQKALLFELFERQKILRRAIEQILSSALVKTARYRRHPLIMMDNKVAQEWLYFLIKQYSGVSLLTSQVERALLAVKTAKAAEIHQLAARVELHFTTTHFVVKTRKK